ncbi:sak1 [Fusarium albosuccineum]|uniref:Sak1 n=1 Tax=Fusarium albosuccineum TaxID=1237068 RepID=A0A8H4PD31_9HYPO|nr:sak1 [Fusarium albosuccineum]
MEQMDNPAARTSVKSRKRPLSRASTTSIHSVTTQPTLDQSGFADASDMYAGQWIPNEHAHAHAHAHAHGHAKDMAAAQLSPEDMILQAATHMQGAGQDFSMDASMSAPMGHPMQYQQKHPMQRHPLPGEQYTNNASFTDGDSQMMERDDNEEVDSMVGMVGAPKPASTRSSANNELEMRQLFSANRNRSLQDVAGELHGNERGPNSERTRQVFAMLWINSVCSKGKGSVPRGRVYANYASRCATERITVLNPASFGKLVRVLFPGLKTRRLGVRGESKYHYVNFTLEDDQPEIREPSAQPTRPLPEAASFTQSFNTAPTQSSTNLGHGALPSPHIGTEIKTAPTSSQPVVRSHSLYNQPEVASLDHLHNTTTKTQLELAFPPENEEVLELSDPLPLPHIESYLPPGTDPDAAKSLSALYRSHCTSLVECIRYCREKTFFHLYTSFQGTLTMPVQKLFGNPALAPWIEECDFVLYHRMMRIVSGLTLQVVPKPVLDTLRNISERLVTHIRDSFQGQPQHVIRAKEAPATLFAGLITRALRVNLTAHAAANMLSNPANRDQMYIDWITMIRARKIAECVPTRGMDDVVNILLNQMRELLDPINVPWEVECLTIYADVKARSGHQLDGDGSSSSSGQNVLERWVSFMKSLPAKFPYASHSDIVWCVERVGTAVMRDITLAQGKSFGSWWVTKTWVDEMVCFLAEQGGFMKQKSSHMTGAPTSTPPQPAKETSRQNSRYSSGSDELNLNNTSQNQGERAPFPPANKATQNTMSMSGGDAHDDSGIGIRTPEEDFPMDKFGFTGAENQDHGLLTGSELVGGAGL